MSCLDQRSKLERLSCEEYLKFIRQILDDRKTSPSWGGFDSIKSQHVEKEFLCAKHMQTSKSTCLVFAPNTTTPAWRPSLQRCRSHLAGETPGPQRRQTEPVKRTCHAVKRNQCIHTEVLNRNLRVRVDILQHLHPVHPVRPMWKRAKRGARSDDEKR